jgi:hypothetical protein
MPTLFGNLSRPVREVTNERKPSAAHAKSSLSRTDDDDIFHVQATAGSGQAELSANDQKDAETRQRSCHQIEAWG